MIQSYLPRFFDEETGCLAERITAGKAEILASGWFANPEVIEYPWENISDAAGYIKGFNTYSKYAVLDEGIKQQLNREMERIINAHGGKIAHQGVAVLYLAKKI